MFVALPFPMDQFRGLMLSVLDGLEFERQDLQEVGDFVVNAIIERTSAGRDWKDQPFHPYSDAYRRFRESRGRSSTPDLTFTGLSIASLTADASADDIVIFYFNRDAARIMQLHNANFDEDPRPRNQLPMRRHLDIDPESQLQTDMNEMGAEILARKIEREFHSIEPGEDA